MARAARGAAAKRTFDLIAVVGTAPVWVPTVAGLALAVRATSPGGAFFVQPRVGRRGRMFGCVKLRTMRADAEEYLRELLDRDPALRREFARDFKLRCDPRITKVGKVLRVTGLDELPQLLSVLSGEMSLVGPRPVVEDETAYYGPYLELVQSLRPGLTGLWQVSGRNDIPYEQRVALDVEYALTRTFLGDLRIILRTLLMAFRPRQRGAY
ncbi:MAG: sugar transferase [Actinomycetes bacterium]